MALWKKKVNGWPPDDPILDSIYSKYPAFKNMGTVTLKADTNFTRDKTGIGDIEYFGLGDGRGVHYPNGLYTPHPDPTGKSHGILYNPKTNDEQNIMLDMLHGMKKDPIYAKHRDEFANEFIKANGGDLRNDWEQDKKKYGEQDGFNAFKNNWIDGQIRGLMFEGTPEKFKQQNYWKDAKKTYLQNKNIATKFQQIQDYLKTGVAYTLPEVVITASQSNQNKLKFRKP